MSQTEDCDGFNPRRGTEREDQKNPRGEGVNAPLGITPFRAQLRRAVEGRGESRWELGGEKRWRVVEALDPGYGAEDEEDLGLDLEGEIEGLGGGVDAEGGAGESPGYKPGDDGQRGLCYTNGEAGKGVMMEKGKGTGKGST